MDVQFEQGETVIRDDSKVYPYVAVGGKTMAAVTDGGVLYTWGDNTYGQLGIGLTSDATPYSTTPTVAINGNVKKVVVGDGFMVAVTINGEVYAWGRNDNGQLGNSTKDNSISPVRVEGIDNVVDIAVGLNHTLLLTNTGDIYAFGDGSNHQVIPELTETALTPQKLHIKSSLEIAAVYADNNTSYALTRNGDIIAWGENTSYKFGDGDYYGNGIAYADIAEKAVTMSASTNSVLALSETSHVWAWGSNNHNQLGMYLKDDNTYETVVENPTLSDVYNETVEGEDWTPNGVTAGESAFVTYITDIQEFVVITKLTTRTVVNLV